MSRRPSSPIIVTGSLFKISKRSNTIFDRPYQKLISHEISLTPLYKNNKLKSGNNKDVLLGAGLVNYLKLDHLNINQNN